MSARPPSGLVALLIACAACAPDGGESSPPPAPTPPAEDPPPWPSGYDPGVDGVLAPSITAAQATALVPEMLALVATLDPDQMIAVYDELMTHGDEICPAAKTYVGEEGETAVQWFNDCESADGTRFIGGATRTTYDRVLADGTKETGYALSAFGCYFDIKLADGRSLRGTPFLDARIEETKDGTTFTLSLYNSPKADPTTAAGNPWLSGQIMGGVSLYASVYGTSRARSYTANCAVPYHDEIAAFELSEWMVDQPADCSLRTTGKISLRSRTGGWHDVGFGAPDAAAGTCDACADLSFSGKAIDDLCIDPATLSTLLSWETTPW
jgi:hypothetical protein